MPGYWATYCTNSFCWCDLSHVQYSSKDPCCSLACDHRSISGCRFSLPKWVERSDDRKYVCVRRLAVPKRHNICSSSSSLATCSTCNHFLRLVDTIPRAPRAPLFQIFLSSLFKSWYFSNFSSEILVSKGRAISIMRHFPSFLSITTTPGLFLLFVFPLSNLFIPLSPTSFYSPRRREPHSRPLYELYRGTCQKLAGGTGVGIINFGSKRGDPFLQWE